MLKTMEIRPCINRLSFVIRCVLTGHFWTIYFSCSYSCAWRYTIKGIYIIMLVDKTKRSKRYHIWQIKPSASMFIHKRLVNLSHLKHVNIRYIQNIRFVPFLYSPQIHAINDIFTNPETITITTTTVVFYQLRISAEYRSFILSP